jgi:hypothetical protein
LVFAYTKANTEKIKKKLFFDITERVIKEAE